MPRWSRSPMSAGSGTQSLARAWLTGTTRNLARARLRRREPLPTDLADMPSADDLERRIEEAALRDWVWEAIGGLSEPLHDVVVLRYFSMAASYDAIAAALGIPVGTVRSRLHDARAALVSRLRELELAAADDHSRCDASARAAVRRDRRRSTTAATNPPCSPARSPTGPTHRGRQRRGLRRPGRNHARPGGGHRSRSPTAACSAWWPAPGSPWSKARSTTPQTRRITARRSPPRSTGTAARRSSAFIWPTRPAEQRTFRPAHDTSRHDNNRLPHPELPRGVPVPGLRQPRIRGPRPVHRRPYRSCARLARPGHRQGAPAHPRGGRRAGLAQRLRGADLRDDVLDPGQARHLPDTGPLVAGVRRRAATTPERARFHRDRCQTSGTRRTSPGSPT